VTRIVCNTGPLIALGLLGHLDLLKSLFSEVLIPEAVQREIYQGGVSQRGVDSFGRADWIRVVVLLADGTHCWSRCWTLGKRPSSVWPASKA
jgi:predicted nucleic acid-binding protein